MLDECHRKMKEERDRKVEEDGKAVKTESKTRGSAT